MTEPTHVARGLAGEEIPDGEDRILTAPNLITLVRLLCIPLFLWLLFGRDDRFWAAALLAVLGATDWVDGYVARHFGQVSNLGKMFDPTVDRLLMVVGIAAIMLDDLQVSWFMPFAWVVVVREVLLSTFVVLTVALGARRMDVSWFGKAGTFFDQLKGLQYNTGMWLSQNSSELLSTMPMLVARAKVLLNELETAFSAIPSGK